MNSKHIGSTLDSFFEEDGLLEQVQLLAKDKIIADLESEIRALKLRVEELEDESADACVRAWGGDLG